MTRKEQLLELSKQISEQDREAFAEAYRKFVTKQVSHIYIDISYLQDCYLGAILHLTADKQVYPYILQQLSQYNERITECHVTAFPDLQLTEEQLEEYVKNPEHADVLIKTSPPTDMYMALRAIHVDILRTNRSKCSLGVSPVTQLTYIINTWPLVLEKTTMLFLKARFMLALKDTSINFGIISTPSYNLGKDIATQIDHWYVDKFSEWGEHPKSPVYKLLFVEKAMQYCKIYIPPRITNPETLSKMATMTEQDFLNMEKATLMQLNMFSEIRYIRSHVSLRKKD